MLKTSFIALFLLTISFSNAQETYRYVLTLNSENDAFVAWENRDRYYTYGLGAALSFKTNKLLGLQRFFPDKEGNFFTIGLRIEGYTPTNKVVSEEQLQVDSLIVFDRPFAGLFFGTLESSYTFK